MVLNQEDSFWWQVSTYGVHLGFEIWDGVWGMGIEAEEGGYLLGSKRCLPQVELSHLICFLLLFSCCHPGGTLWGQKCCWTYSKPDFGGEVCSYDQHGLMIIV